MPDGRRLQGGSPTRCTARRDANDRVVRARRVRAEIASALAETRERDGRRSAAARRPRHDSDFDIDAKTLLAGARRAAQLYDLPLAERLARAAVTPVAAPRRTTRHVHGGRDREQPVGRPRAAQRAVRTRQPVRQRDRRPSDKSCVDRRKARCRRGIGARLRAPVRRPEGGPAGARRAVLSRGLPGSTPARVGPCRPGAGRGLPDESIAFASCARTLALATTGSGR